MTIEKNDKRKAFEMTNNKNDEKKAHIQWK